MDVCLYFRVHGVAKDDKGEPIAAGLRITLGTSETPPSYEELSGNLTEQDIDQLLVECGMRDLFTRAELISPEEYEAEFGERKE